MTETRTLQFDSPRALQSLYANDIKLLKNLEDSLGVKVTTREGWVKLEGDSSHVDKAQQVFQQLEKARQQGVDIQRHEFNYTLKAQAPDRCAKRKPAGLCRGNSKARRRFWNWAGWHGKNLPCRRHGGRGA